MVAAYNDNSADFVTLIFLNSISCPSCLAHFSCSTNQVAVISSKTVEFKEGLYLRFKGKETCDMMRLFGERRFQWPLRFHFQMSGYVSCQLRRESWIVCSNRWDCHTAAAWPRTQLADAKSEANYRFTMIRGSFLEES